MFAVKGAAVSDVKDPTQRHIHAIIDDSDRCRATLDPSAPAAAAGAFSAAGGLLGRAPCRGRGSYTHSAPLLLPFIHPSYTPQTLIIHP